MNLVYLASSVFYETNVTYGIELFIQILPPNNVDSGC
jgi:hypothetical protein